MNKKPHSPRLSLRRWGLPNLSKQNTSMKIGKREAAFILAALITLTCVGMAVGAALERSSTPWDAALYSLGAAVLLVGAHVLPAMSGRRPGVLVLSCLCLVVSLYHLLHFFSAAETRAGHARASSSQTKDGQGAVAVQAELARLKARPLTAVTAELAQAKLAQARTLAAANRCKGEPGCTHAQGLASTANARLEVLTVEHQAALRADELAQQLTRLATAADQTSAQQLRDPVNLLIAAVTGCDERAVSLAANLALGALLEALGISAWVIALGNSTPSASPTGASDESTQGKLAPAAGKEAVRFERRVRRSPPAFINAGTPHEKERAVQPPGAGWLPALLSKVASTPLRNLLGGRGLQHTNP